MPPVQTANSPSTSPISPAAAQKNPYAELRQKVCAAFEKAVKLLADHADAIIAGSLLFVGAVMLFHVSLELSSLILLAAKVAMYAGVALGVFALVNSASDFTKQPSSTDFRNWGTPAFEGVPLPYGVAAYNVP